MLAQSIDTALPRQGDSRADGGERQVALGRSDVFIERSLSGMRMRVRLSTRAYRGVVLTLGETPAGCPFYRISLWHADRDFSVKLHEAVDDSDIVASWKSWAAYFGLPKFIERAPGELEGAETRLGEIAIGKARVPRRRGAAIAKRRGRLPLRRKMGDASRPTPVHAGEYFGEIWERPTA